MIEITYYKGHNRVTVIGHALAGEPGKDLVCAGVTAIVYTLATNVQWLEETGAVREMEARLDPGDACIRCVPVSAMRATVKLIFTCLCAGLEQMACTYPEYVRYEVHGEG